MGHWDVDPDYPVEDWKAEVANDDTRLGYSDWIENSRDADELARTCAADNCDENTGDDTGVTRFCEAHRIVG